MPTKLNSGFTARFWSKVKLGPGCWEWTGFINSDGYGHISRGSAQLGAHRASWEIHHGPIPPGQQVRHVCGNRRCVNPDHLQLYEPNATEVDGRPVSSTFERRFWEKVKLGPGCWEWAATPGQRYGLIGPGTNGTGKIRAHRASYELHKGPIPPGMEIHHLCGNTRCVNPDHLEPLPGRENNRLGGSPPAVNARKARCKRGHLLSGDNLRISRGWRICRACHRMHSRRFRQKRRAEAESAEVGHQASTKED